jgi:peptide/nickel transport system substrate-binding protein
MARFLGDPAQISAPDPQTVVFTLDRPQPLFEAAVSSQYGGQIVNATRLKELESEGDWGHDWAELNQEGLGTGPYRITSFEPEQQVILERFDGYWRDWQAGQFDQVVIRVVPEGAARRQLVERGDADIVDGLDPEALEALEQDPDVIVDHSYGTEVD